MDVQAGVHGSILGPLLFLIYINDLPPDSLTSNPKLFADDTPLFSTVTDPNVTANQINNNSQNISTWTHQWKMNFNPDTCEQAQEVIISCKVKVTAHSKLAFDNNLVHETATQKHLGIFLDFNIIFKNILRICSIRLIKL